MKPREVSWNDISVLMGKTVDIMVCEKSRLWWMKNVVNKLEADMFK